MKLIRTKEGQKIWFEQLGMDIWVHFQNESFKLEKTSELTSKKYQADALNTSFVASPIPGKITSINVKEGDIVQKDQLLVVLESMKMEHSLLAPRDLKVKSILIKKGDLVKKNKVLLNF